MAVVSSVRRLVGTVLPVVVAAALAVESAPSCRAARLTGTARALATVRASRAERERRDAARDELALRRTAAVVRLRNDTADLDIPARLACAVETYLRDRGLTVKDHRAVAPIITQRGFNRWQSSAGLRWLGGELQANLLVFLCIETCLVTSFADEYRKVAATGNISFPDDEFVELQVRASVFDVADGRLLFTHRDRQFNPYCSGNSGLVRQEAFESALGACVNNLFGPLR